MNTPSDISVTLSIRHAKVLGMNVWPSQRTDLARFFVEAVVRNNSDKMFAFSHNLSTMHLVDSKGNSIRHVLTNIDPGSPDCFPIGPDESTSIEIEGLVFRPVNLDELYSARLKNNDLEATADFKFQGLT